MRIDVTGQTSSGGGSGSNASVGTTGTTAPTSATEVGYINGGGNLTGVSPSTPLPTAPAQATAANLQMTANQPTAANLNATVIGLGTAGTPAGGVMTIQGQTSMTPVKTDGSATTQPVSGTVTANISGSISNTSFVATQSTASALNMTDATGVSIQGSVAPGTAATKSALTGIVYNSTPVSALTNGQQVAAQADVNGNLQTVQQDLLYTGQAAQTATVNNIIPATAGANATNAQGFRSATIQINSSGTAGGYIFEGSNDNTNFFALTAYNATVLTGTPITAAVVPTAANILYILPITTQYIRVRISTAVTGGSIQAYTRLSQATWTPPVFQVAQATGADLNAAIYSLPTLAAVTTVSTVSSVTSGNVGIPTPIADVASAAITTTTTTAAFTPTFGSSYNVQIPVTAVTGTTPTMSVAIQESPDGGTNWTTVYTFPTITATGSYVSPTLTLQGNRVRYVQTLTGTTPSFTRAINRLQCSQANLNQPGTGVLTDASGTCSATPSTATTATAANQYRRYLLLQNTSTTATLWFNFTTTAVAGEPSLQLPPGASFVQESGYVSTEAISVLSTTASAPYSLKVG